MKRDDDFRESVAAARRRFRSPANVVDLMDALRQSIGKAMPPPAKPAKKGRKASAGQKEMLMPIQCKAQKRRRKSLHPSNANRPSTIANRGRGRTD